jgi:hypothetical protein
VPGPEDGRESVGWEKKTGRGWLWRLGVGVEKFPITKEGTHIYRRNLRVRV